MSIVVIGIMNNFYHQVENVVHIVENVIHVVSGMVERVALKDGKFDVMLVLIEIYYS